LYDLFCLALFSAEEIIATTPGRIVHKKPQVNGFH
jgi:hypothetical protein